MEELQKFSVGSNLRRALEDYRQEPASLSDAERSIAEQLQREHGDDRVSIYDVPVGNSSALLFEIAASPEPLLGIYADGDWAATAHRPWTFYGFEHPTDSVPSWATDLEARADKENLRDTLADQAVESSALPAGLRTLAAENPKASWFQFPDAEPQGYAAIWIGGGAVNLSMYSGNEAVSVGKRPFAVYIFDGTVTLPSPKPSADMSSDAFDVNAAPSTEQGPVTDRMNAAEANRLSGHKAPSPDFFAVRKKD